MVWRSLLPVHLDVDQPKAQERCCGLIEDRRNPSHVLPRLGEKGFNCTSHSGGEQNQITR